MQGGVDIKKDESGNKISKQMNTWALLSNWSHDDFHNEPLVSILNFFLFRNIILIAALPPVEIAILLWKPFVDYLCTNRPFGFSARASLFLGFFLFFYCFTVRLRLELCSKWMKISYFPKEENSLTQVPAFDPNGLSKYVM